MPVFHSILHASYIIVVFISIDYPFNLIFRQKACKQKSLHLFNYCQGKIRCSFGIGTNLTNDTGFKPSNIVMKLAQCRMNSHQDWRECIKLSDDMGKHMGSSAELEACLYELKLKS